MSWNTPAARGAAVWVVLGAVLMLLPGSLDRGAQETLLTLLMWVALAQAWNIVGGISGQMSLGHSVFVGAGGYAAAMLTIKAGVPWWLGLVGAVVLSMALAWLISFPLLRLSDVYFTIGSSAVALVAMGWMVTWGWTGESRGLNIPFELLPEKATVFRLMALCAVATSLVAHAVLHSSFGLRLMAVRDDEGAAEALGTTPRRVKRQAFVLSGLLTGLTGGVVAYNQVSINPTNMFSLDWVVMMLVMAIVGGLGTVWGPVTGAVVMFYVLDRALAGQPMLAAVLTGLLLIVVISLFPGGLVEMVRRAWSAVALRLRLPGSVMRRSVEMKEAGA